MFQPSSRGISFTRASPARAKFGGQGSPDFAAWTALATLAYGLDSWTGPATVDEDASVTPRNGTVHDDLAFDVARKRFFRLRVQRAVSMSGRLFRRTISHDGQQGAGEEFTVHSEGLSHGDAEMTFVRIARFPARE